ncbi:MAG: diguanylate cyclase, partial [Microcystaceae cyanobacterium]
VTDGKSALLEATSTHPDLILLNVMMPEMDGYQICQAFKQSKKTKQIPIIFMSELEEVEYKVKCFQVGGVDHIAKSCHIREILARIEVHIECYQRRKSLKAKNKKLKRVVKEKQDVENKLILLEQAIAACENGVLITDAKQENNPIIYVNPAFEKLTGYSFEEAQGKNPRFLQSRDRQQPDLAIIREAIIQGKSCQVILKNYHKSGEFYWHEVFISPIRNLNGEITHFVGVQNDITKRRKIEEALVKSEQKFASAFRASPDPIAITSLANGQFIDVNRSFCDISEYNPEEVINHTASDLNLWVDEQACLVLCKKLQSEDTVCDQEVRLRAKSGEIKTLLLSAELIELENKPCMLTIAKDITERQRIKQALEAANMELYRLANVDGLTQVANRRRFDESLETEWQRCYREKQYLSLIFCDVDEFKRYNDYYEHLRGDDCLIQVAKTINQGIRRATDVVARYGGEEFAVILPNTDKKGAMKVAKNIQSLMRKLKLPHANSTVSSYVTLSMGVVSLIPQADFNPTELIRLADKGLFEAKKQGRDRIIVSDAKINNQLSC